MIKAWQDYNEQLARQNNLTRHGQADPATGYDRVSFFRSDDFLEAESGSIHSMHSPYIVCTPIDGKPVGPPPATRKRLSTKMYFLARPAEGAVSDAREDVLDLTYTLMSQFIAKYNEDAEALGKCGPFYTLNIGRFMQVGPRIHGDYGWQLSLEFSEKAPEYVYDPSKWTL